MKTRHLLLAIAILSPVLPGSAALVRHYPFDGTFADKIGGAAAQTTEVVPFFTFDGRYAKVGKVKAGQKAVLTFPITERTVKTEFPGNLNQGRIYTLVLRGNDVVKIDPPGTSYPLYQRSHYRTGETLCRKVTRFVPDQELNW